MKAILFLSAKLISGISLEIISVFFKLGLVSPVKLDSSISKSTAY